MEDGRWWAVSERLVLAMNARKTDSARVLKPVGNVAVLQGSKHHTPNVVMHGLCGGLGKCGRFRRRGRWVAVLQAINTPSPSVRACSEGPEKIAAKGGLSGVLQAIETPKPSCAGLFGRCDVSARRVT